MKYENFEVNVIKDDLHTLSVIYEGTHDGEVLSKALDYINELEELLGTVLRDENRAMNLLREKGYVIKKWTKAMEIDAKECEECDYEGDCSCCACSVCLMQ